MQHHLSPLQVFQAINFKALTPVVCCKQVQSVQKLSPIKTFYELQKFITL